MGLGLSATSAKEIMRKGQMIKEDLYSRVSKFSQAHKEEFNQINNNLKHQVYLSSATQLITLLQSKRVTSQQLVLIFAQRSSTVGIQNNYIFDEMFEQALESAKQCDKERRQNPNKKNWKGESQSIGECFPPFYGIPASYKENIQMKGKTSHVGFIIPHEKNYSKEHNGLFAEMTIRMGFIPFVRTNVPMSCKTIQTNNNMFGYSMNPWNSKRSCGGSSGGEGGLIGAYCSPIGFGTDIGGSLRIPAQWNGLMTLKPGNRYSRLGNSFYGKLSGGTPIKADLGPITRSVTDIELFMKYMCDINNYSTIPRQIMDPYLNVRPWNTTTSRQSDKNTNNKLRIGYITDLQTISCSPSHKRVVQQAVSILRQQGHQVIEITMPRFQQLYINMLQMYMADGSTRVLNQIALDQPYIPEFKLLEISSKVPNFVKTTLAYVMSFVNMKQLIQKRQPRMATVLRNNLRLNVGDTFAKIYDMQNQLTDMVYHYFIDNDIDAVLMPGFGFPSPVRGTVSKLQYTFAYTTSWNVVNYPVGSMPMGVVEHNEQLYQDKFNDSITQSIRENMKQSQGMPVGIQIASLPYQQELILQLMKTIEEQTKFRSRYQCKNILKE